MQLVLSKGERVITRYIIDRTSIDTIEIDAENAHEALEEALDTDNQHFEATNTEWHVYNGENYDEIPIDWTLINAEPEAVDPAA